MNIINKIFLWIHLWKIKEKWYSTSMCMILQGKKSKFNRLTYSYTCINQVLSWILLEKRSIFVTRWLRNHFCLIRWVTDLCPMSYKTVQFGFYPSTGINAFYRFLKNRIDKGREKYFRITLDHNSFLSYL